jgi:hypothetical protein
MTGQQCARIEVPTGNDRTQKVYVESGTLELGDQELRRMYSAAYVSRDDLPRRTIDALLAQNRDLPFGAWATFLDGGELFLVFEAKLPAVLSPDTLREVIQFVAQTADDVEATLSTVDNY